MRETHIRKNVKSKDRNTIRGADRHGTERDPHKKTGTAVGLGWPMAKVPPLPLYIAKGRIRRKKTL